MNGEGGVGGASSDEEAVDEHGGEEHQEFRKAVRQHYSNEADAMKLAQVRSIHPSIVSLDSCSFFFSDRSFFFRDD